MEQPPPVPPGLALRRQRPPALARPSWMSLSALRRCCGGSSPGGIPDDWSWQWTPAGALPAPICSSRSAPRAGIPTCGIGAPSPSAPPAANACPPAPSSPFPTLPGSVVAPPSAGLRPAPLHPAGGLVRRAGGTLDHPHRPALRRRSAVSWYALRFWIELGFKACPVLDTGALKSLGWKWDKTRRTDPDPRLPPLAGAARWPPCWPWPTAPGWRTLTIVGIAPEQPAHAAQGPGSQSSGPSDPSGAYRQRRPLRHRLAPAADAQGPPVELGLTAPRTLAGTQVQPEGDPPCALVTTVTYPFQTRGEGVLQSSYSAELHRIICVGLP